MEFEQLKLGEMIVQQYKIKFIELSHFAPALVVTTKQRITRFSRGLQPEIYKDVTSFDIPIFENNLRKAFWSVDCANKIRITQSQPRDGESIFKRPNPTLSLV